MTIKDHKTHRGQKIFKVLDAEGGRILGYQVQGFTKLFATESAAVGYIDDTFNQAMEASASEETPLRPRMRL